MAIVAAACIQHWRNKLQEYGVTTEPAGFLKCIEDAGKYAHPRCWRYIYYGTKVKSPLTICTPGCDLVTGNTVILGKGDVNCSTCSGYLNLVMTLKHECVHERQICYANTHACMEVEAYQISILDFERTIKNSCKNIVADGFCKSVAECTDIGKQIVIADKAILAKYWEQCWWSKGRKIFWPEDLSY